jgi:hypothetical protein
MIAFMAQLIIVIDVMTNTRIPADSAGVVKVAILVVDVMARRPFASPKVPLHPAIEFQHNRHRAGPSIPLLTRCRRSDTREMR